MRLQRPTHPGGRRRRPASRTAPAPRSFGLVAILLVTAFPYVPSIAVGAPTEPEVAVESAAATTAALIAGLEPAPAGIDPVELARRADEVMRSDTTHMRARMIVRSPRLSSDRVVEFESWDDKPGKRNLIRIIEPSKDRGTGFLKLQPNLWMYVPRVERTVRIPPSMMMQSWMGSDFTNDDLVNESSDVDDYEHTLLGVDPKAGPAGDQRAYVIAYEPKEDVAVVWGRIVGWIDTETNTPWRQDFYDEDDVAIRRMTFGDVRQLGDRHVPHVWHLTPLDKEGHGTTVELEEIEFDTDLDDAIFTTRNLKRTH